MRDEQIIRESDKLQICYFLNYNVPYIGRLMRAEGVRFLASLLCNLKQRDGMSGVANWFLQLFRANNMAFVTSNLHTDGVRCVSL